MKKFLVFCLFLIVLSSILNIIYNKRGGTVLAQDSKFRCAVEIPIGEVADDTESLLQEIIGAAEIIVRNSEEAAASGTELTNLADQCKAENCQTGCNQYIYQCNPYKCNPRQCNPHPCQNNPKQTCYDTCYDTCYQTCYACEVNPCSGSPCPNDQISNEIQKIKNNYGKIEIAHKGGKLNGEEIEGIKNLIETTPEIFSKLGDSRNKLRACTSPTEDYQKYLSGGEFSTPLLLKCSSAKSIDSTLINCHFNNYFCCQ